MDDILCVEDNMLRGGQGRQTEDRQTPGCSIHCVIHHCPSYFHTQMMDNHPWHPKPHSKLQLRKSWLMNSTRQVLPISGNIHLTVEFKISEQPPLKKGPMKAYGRHHNNSFSNTPATISGKASLSYVVGLNSSSRTTSSIDSLIDKLNPAPVSVFSSGKASSSITSSNKLPIDKHKESRCSAATRHL